MVQLFLNLGKKHHISAGDIVGMLHHECQLERGSVGRIKLNPGFSLIEVREDCAEQALEGARRAKLRGKPFKLDYDRGKDERRRSGGHSRDRRRDDRRRKR